MGEAIATGNYTPKKDISHTHVGSLGDLALDSIRAKMEAVLKNKNPCVSKDFHLAIVFAFPIP